MAEGFVPPPQVRANAKRGLELRKEHNRGGTEVGVARARDLSNGAALSLDTVKRMNSYFARHEVDKKGEGWGVDSAGYIAWLLWGGDAGWSWARGILRQQESKEKSTVNDLTTSYFSIEKSDKQPDGTLMVYGKATDDSVDIDQQICDAAWLDRAMPAWFKSGGNIREQHSSIAAGVAKEYEAKADGHYIMAHVVDPVSVKKVDAGVLRGFSIGIKSPRVVRDTKAVNGRIIDGQIVEVSLVDRPANPNCQLVLAKSVDGESGLIQVEELTEDIIKHPGHDQSSHGRGGGNAGAGAGAAGAGGGGGGGGSAGGDGEGSGKIMRGGAKTATRAHQSRVKELVDDPSAARSKAQPKLKETQGHLKEASNRDRTPDSVRGHLKDASASLDNAASTFKAEGNTLMAGATAKVSAGIKRTISQLPEGNSWESGKSADADFDEQGEWIGKKEEEDFTQVIKPRKGEPADKDLYEEVKRAAKAKFDVYPSAYANAWVVREYKKRGGKYKAETEKALQSDTIEMEFDMTKASELVEVSQSYESGSLLKFDQKTYETARTALADLIAIEAAEMSESGHNETDSLQCLLAAVHHLFAWYEGEKAEGEVMEEVIEMALKPKMKELKPLNGESEKEYKARCKEAGMDDETIKAMCDKYMGAEKGAEPNPVPTQETYATLAGTVIVPPTETPKSAEADEAVEAPTEEAAVDETPAEAPVEEAVTENSEAPTEVDAADVEAIVEQVVKSATESLRAEITSLVAAKEAALEKSVVLESELAIAKSLAVAGGPSRTVRPLSTKINDNITKAAIYKAKANATTDPVLAKGYKILAEEFYSKAADGENN